VRITLTALSVCALACGGAGNGSGSTEIDSAGVRVVTSTAPVWGQQQRWLVDTQPDVEVGDATSANNTMLVSVSSARTLSDGRYVVSLNDESRLQMFDKDGREAGTFGVNGDGPGEFREPTIVGSRADSLMVWDFPLGRATVVTPEGELGRTFTIQQESVPSEVRYGFGISGWMANGTLLLAGQSGVASGERDGYRRDTIPLAFASATGELQKIFTSVPGNEQVAVSEPDFVTSLGRPFGAVTVLRVDENSILVGVGDVDELRRYDSAGELREIYRLDRPRKIIPPTDFERHGRRLGAQTAQLPPRVGEAITSAVISAGLPAVYPAYDRIVVDGTGAIWLREDIGEERENDEDHRWTVLDKAGHWLGTVVTPRRFDVQQITEDQVIGVKRDEYGVELLRAHRLRR
jgi:hypothetical protein